MLCVISSRAYGYKQSNLLLSRSWVYMNTEGDEELTALWEISPGGLDRTNSREKFPLKNYGYPLTLSNLWGSV